MSPDRFNECLRHIRWTPINVERAVTTIRDMWETIGIPSARVSADKIIDLMVSAIGAEAKTSEEVRAAILASAGMIRDLHIVMNTGTEIQIGDGGTGQNS